MMIIKRNRIVHYQKRSLSVLPRNNPQLSRTMSLKINSKVITQLRSIASLKLS
jgi:hypothetical protein